MSRQLTDIAHEHVARAVQPGNVVVDATVGNGHDALLLAQLVGENGRVYGFDIQEIAIRQTRQLIENANIGHVDLIHASHADMLDHLPSTSRGDVAAVMFNLGYLPGTDKTVITQPESTRSAIQAACGILKVGGVLTVMAYPGHDGGEVELAEVESLLADLPVDEFQVKREPQPRPTAPHLFLIQRLSTSKAEN